MDFEKEIKRDPNLFTAKKGSNDSEQCRLSSSYLMNIKQMLCQDIISLKLLLTQWTSKRSLIRVRRCHMPLQASDMLNSLKTNWTLEWVLLTTMIWFTVLFICCKGIETSSTLAIKDIYIHVDSTLIFIAYEEKR